MRTIPASVKELDIVACDGDTIVGYIMYSKAQVIDEQNKGYEVLCMGPLAVAPDRQKQGIGSMLMNASAKKAKDLGYKGVIIFGDPQYYHRFGFVDAKTYGITTPEGINMEPFMALELFPGSLQGITGKFYTDKVFETDPQEVEEFEKGFPYREKHITDTQLKH